MSLPLIEELPTDEGLEKKTVVLMITCKRYEQAWMPFMTLFNRYWPDCPYRFVMGTDTGSIDSVEIINVGKDLGWSDNCMYILNQLNEERVILFFDDFLPIAPFNTDKIRRFVRHAYDHDIGCLRFAPCPGPTAAWNKTASLGVLQPRDPYRLSLQTALWKRTLLLDLMRKGETGWDTEIKGTIRASKRIEPFVSVWRGESPTPYYITAIVKGVWQDKALEMLVKENISLDKITKIIR
jgi:hypothetical protein